MVYLKIGIRNHAMFMYRSGLRKEKSWDCGLREYFVRDDGISH